MRHSAAWTLALAVSRRLVIVDCFTGIMSTSTLRAPLPSESAALLDVAVQTGVFQPDEAAELLGSTLHSYHSSELGENHEILVAADAADVPRGWCYFAPTPAAEGVWDLWWIGVSPDVQGTGLGKQLMQAVHDRALEASARVLVVETSSQPLFERTRRWYERQGFTKCGQVPDFYAMGDDKVIFAKTLQSEGQGASNL
eukprot:scaffold8583_cov296-Pinguiococcus_pyrenoidosus.AAC.1